ncbi:universal stress protein [Microtetraspora sp. AC03309]|uniref:universal stress protein n=1 Tax=Microtetraspora sp. AC03309 TaxID=2779376 RepID=UPI001E2B7ED0|nr:universal stress protein [Microtetraspora sp. AC03309]MCC5579380.1 universal stress protein [Microtetraspora sp. AC03309]
MIIVGVDGSAAGLEAASWAAREAALRGTSLRVVHAMPKWASEMPGHGPYTDVARWMREGAESVLEEALTRIGEQEGDVAVDSALLPGDARIALIKAAEEAELLVVGNHGLGGFRGLLVGSVALGVAGRASCEVVVVRTLPVNVRRRIVVGVDGSPANAAAIDFAFSEAALHDTELHAVHAWRGLVAGGGFEAAASVQEEDGLRGMLTESVAEAARRHPDVKVTEHVVNGHPVEVLKEASAGAGLLVVGARGRSGLAGLVLGSVSNALLQHADCPVAVVPAR